MRNLWLTIIYAAILVVALVLIALILYPPFVTLITIGVIGLLALASISVCLGLCDSAREGLEAAKLDETMDTYREYTAHDIS